MSNIGDIISTLLLLFIIAIAVVLFFKMLKNKSTFQKLNRVTIIAVVVTFIGLLFLGYGLLNAVLGSILVLFLIRTSYVIYVDSN